MERRVGIVVAMANEIRTLALRPIRLGETLPLPGGFLLHLSGVGARRAQRAAEALLGEGATHLLSWGSAGGLIPGLQPGTLLLADTILSSDQSQIPVDPEWHGRFWGRLEGHVGLHRGLLAESKGVLMRVEDKRAFSFRTGAAAVDMESAAVARAAHRVGIPFLAVRAISDGVGETLPSTILTAFDKAGQLNLGSAVKAILGDLRELPAWVRFWWGFRSAHKTLARVATLARSDFLAPPSS